jgi:hypothetical protein
MRLLQFRLPRADGDARDGEAVVFTNIGGSPQSNVDRWRGQFQEVAKDRDAVTEVTEGVKGKVTFLDITGKYGGGMGGAADPHAGSGGGVETRMIGAVVESADGVYYVKVTGPPPTIGKWEKAIRDFVLESARK